MLGSNIFLKKTKIAIRFNLPKVCPSVSPIVFAVLFTGVIFIFLLSSVVLTDFSFIMWELENMFQWKGFADKFRETAEQLNARAKVYLNGVKNTSSVVKRPKI